MNQIVRVREKHLRERERVISLAFADNASNGIEPPFSWYYFRKKREPDGSTTEYEVADHAWRLYRAWGGDVNALPPYFVTALDMHALDHMRMEKSVSLNLAKRKAERAEQKLEKAAALLAKEERKATRSKLAQERREEKARKRAAREQRATA